MAAVVAQEPNRARVPVFEPLTSSRPVEFVLVAIPALNEEQSIGRVVRDLRHHGFECLVVDDGSTDQTGAVARRAGAMVIRHLVTLGQGAALQTAIDWALTNGADMVVTFDADGQHHAADIPVLLEALTSRNADFALGSRFLGAAINLPANRRLLLRAAVWFTRASTGMHVTDTHNGLRAMTRRGASVIHLHQDTMAHASEILSQIAESGLCWVEVPVTIEYNEYALKKGQRSAGSVGILVDLLMGVLQR